MSSRAKKRRQTREESVEMRAELYRADNPEAYFAAKCRVHERMSQNGITPADVDAAFGRGYDEGCMKMSKSFGNIYIAAMVLALNDLYGFGAERACRIMDRMNEYMTEFITDQEAIQAAYDRFGLVYDGTDVFHPLQIVEGRKKKRKEAR